MFFSNDDKIADNKMKQIAEAISEQDKDKLKAMFSEYALDKADNFEENANRLFEFIQGDIQSWERTGGPGVFSNTDHRKIKKEMEATYDIKTDENVYHLSVKICLNDTDNPNKIGVSSLCIIHADNWPYDYNYWGNLDVLGITVDY